METYRHIIEGNLITKETIFRTEAVPLDKLLEGLTAYQPLSITPAPSNLKSMTIKPRPNMQLDAMVIVGHDPGRRRITHKACASNSYREVGISYNLPLPYGLFWFALHGNKLNSSTGEQIVWNPKGWGYMWSKTPFSDFELETYNPALPNIFDDTRICFGANSVDSSLPLGRFIDTSVNTFWTSEFNTDLAHDVPYANLKEWEQSDETEWPHWSTWEDRTPRTITERMDRLSDLGFDWTVPAMSEATTVIPPLPPYLTFDNLETWASGFAPDEIARMKAVLDVCS